MDPNEKVIDYIKNTAEFVRTKDGLVSASNMLERFLFPSSQQYSPIGNFRWREAQIEPVARAYGGTECPDFR